MFDSSLPDLEALASASDAEVVAAIEGWTRAEAAASARRLAGIAELVHRRVEPDGDARLYWACDFWDAAAAEVGAAMGISARRASTQMNIGLALRERLPKVAALFAAGALSYRVINTIAYRTHLVDDAALPALDDALASRAAEYGPLSEDKLDHALDGLITTYDPDARRQIRIAAHGRDVHIGDRDDMTGTATVWGRLLAHDAALLAQRFQQMIHGVCPEDPRTLAQRRADAMGALAAGTTTLTCICGRPDCPHAGQPDARSTSVIIHVTAEPAAVAGPRDPHLHGTDPVPADPPSTDPEPADPAPPAKPGMAYLLGGPALPTPLLAELIATGATVAPLRAPAEDAEPGYRPSKALADFVRARDMTCRFPGCGVPADRCDIDHALAWPVGPTHPSNLRCLCRNTTY